jgi:hypothetical protein
MMSYALLSKKSLNISIDRGSSCSTAELLSLAFLVCFLTDIFEEAMTTEVEDLACWMQFFSLGKANDENDDREFIFANQHKQTRHKIDTTHEMPI